jgi:hypothetical protein
MKSELRRVDKSCLCLKEAVESQRIIEWNKFPLGKEHPKC